MTLEQTIYWLVNSGGGAAVASFILEKLDWFQNQTSSAKQNIYFGATVLITIASYLVMTYVPKEYIDAAAPYFGMLYSSFAAIYIGTAFHKVTKKSNTNG